MAQARRERRIKKNKVQRKKPLDKLLNKLEWIDYKDVAFVRRFINEKNKIQAKRSTGANAKLQRLLAKAVKNAREMALIPYCTSR